MGSGSMPAAYKLKLLLSLTKPRDGAALCAAVKEGGFTTQLIKNLYQWSL